MIHIVTRYTVEEDSRVMRCLESSFRLNVPYAHFLIGKGVWDLELPLRKNLILIETEKKPIQDWGYLMNLYLNIVPDHGQWVFFLDPDNLLHPKFEDVVSDPENLKGSMTVFGQRCGPEDYRDAKPANMEVQKVDLAQVLFNRKAIGELRSWDIYRHDGYFIQEMFIRAREDNKPVNFLNVVASYWNAQRWATA